MIAKTRSFATAVVAALFVVASLCLFAWSGGASAEAPDTAGQTYSEDSLYAFHDALGLDWSEMTEVSAASCTSNSACHGGSWDSVVESTVDRFEGIGQIPAANPHKAHATNAYECADCHSLSGTSKLTCNTCHNFELPEGWDAMDPRTTVYGPSSEKAPYTGDGVVDALAETQE